MKNLEEIKENLNSKKEPVNIKEVNILFLDASASCTGYAIASVNFEDKTADFSSAGAIWFDKDWSHQEKFHYLGTAINNYFWVVEQIDYIVIEQYSLNPNKRMGIHVVPELCGAIKAYAQENAVKVDSMLPQSWRSELGIKRGADGKYKQPTKEKVLTVANVPEESISNITSNSRQTPSDVYDAIAIGWGWLTRLGFSKVKFKDMKFNKHASVLTTLQEI